MANIFSKIISVFKTNTPIQEDKAVEKVSTVKMPERPKAVEATSIDKIIEAVDSLPQDQQQKIDAVVSNLAQGVYGASPPAQKKTSHHQR